MSNFVITSHTNSFEVIENGNGKEYQKGVLCLDVDPNNNQVLQINTTQGRQKIYKIDLTVDSINVDGQTVFADADALRTLLRIHSRISSETFTSRGKLSGLM